MSDVTELRCWPSCVDALDWSQDGIIALASDERVELLVNLPTNFFHASVLITYQFPNTVSYDRDQEVAQWQHIPLQVPWFTNEELPIKRPAPLANYSIGEEISSSAPIALAWSPPGLAKHRRCALAALTANLVLSIWSAEGKQQEASSWDRRLIVNTAITEYFMSNARDEVGHVDTSFGERMRLRTRIRAFAWAPALPNSHSSSTLGSRISYGQHILAICNDDNQLALVVIKSPTTTYGVDPGWTAEVLTHVSLIPESESIFSVPLSFTDRMKQQKHISHVSWSPWIIRGDLYHSIMVYATNEDVRARVVTYMHNSVGLGDEVVYPNLEMRYNGPMKWCPVINEDALILALFTSSGLILVTISTHDASIIEQATHNLDGRWDQVSGAVWEVDRRPIPRLHVSSMLSTIQSPTAVLDTKSGVLDSAGCPSWRDQLENSASLFSAKNDLKGNVKMKVWGLAVSPLGDFIATCHSVHPSDMIEYGSPADRRGTVAVTALLDYRRLYEGFPARNASAEGVLFTLKKLLGNTVEDGNQMPAFIEDIAGKLLRTYGPIGGIRKFSDTSSSTYSEMPLSEIVQHVKRIAFFDAQTLKDRYTILASLACNDSSNNDLQRTLIAYRLTTALQDLPNTFLKTTFSAEIRNHHQQMMKLIEKLIESEQDSVKPAEGSAHETHKGQNGPASATAVPPSSAYRSLNLDLGEATVDTCDFCSAPIMFTDLKTASCTNGHNFPRCGLSLLAIQAPGITKYCGVCSTPFLNEEFVASQELEKRLEYARDPSKGIEEFDPISNHATDAQSDGVEKIGAENGKVVATEMTSFEGRDERKETENGHNAVEGQIEAMAVEGEKNKTCVTFAKVLFLACDACVYCGGKFVG